MKIATIVGARPQFIKAAAVSRAMSSSNKLATSGSSLVTEVIIHTGQHYDDNMSQVFFRELEIPSPDFNLGVGSGSHGRQTGDMLTRIEEVLLSEKPDCVLVYGDTNSTLAGTLAAAKLHIPVAHVEAGMRSYNRRMPEEINRVVADHVANILFCPTQTAVKNLAAEGILDSRPVAVVRTGDVMYDSVLYNLKLAGKKSKIIAKLGLEPGAYALATVHRAENTDDSQRLASIFKAFDQIASGGLPVIIPLHPRTRKIIAEAGLGAKNVQIIAPVSYLDMLMLEKQAQLILTDSGGVQKEAYWMQVPCITLRDETEWVETVGSGWNALAGADTAKIVSLAGTCVRPPAQDQIFGDGCATEKIVAILINAVAAAADFSHRQLNVT